MTAPAVKPKYRSVSQINQFERCPYSYYLSRVLKVWKRPAAWLPQGTAVHAVAENWRRREVAGDPMSLEEAQDLFREEYAKEIGEYSEITPNFEYWFRSGPYGGETDIERRYHIGLEQVEKFVSWTEDHPEEVIWIAPDGTPGIELSFDIELDGIPIRGFIDAVIETQQEGISEFTGEPFKPVLLVRDYKTGNTPGDDFQLGVYGLAIAEMFGVPQPQLGDYYMAGKKGKPGKPTHPFQIGEWTREKVSAKFQALEENLAAERFEPKPEPARCNFCDVATSCEYKV